MSVFKRPGQTTYSYDFRHRRKRFSGSTGCKTKREAEKFEERERQRVAELVIDASAPLTFHAAAARYWNEVGQFHRNQQDTLRSLDWLQRRIGKATMITAITDDDIAALVAKRREEGVSNATVNRSVCEPMRAILRRAKRLDFEWKRHFLKEAQERIREATQDEESDLIEAIRGDYAAPLQFALMSGCRRAEIVGLRWPSVDFFNRVITIKGKGERTRVIPMTMAMYELLKGEHGKDAAHVFTYVAKMPRKDAGMVKPITMEGFKTEWRRARKRSGVENFRFHDLRHTTATRLVRRTGNLKLAQKLLGHTDIATTSRYAHVTDDDLRAGMEATCDAQHITKSATEPTVKRIKL